MCIRDSKNAVKLILAIILTCKGIPPNEKNGALIKKEEIRKDDTKKITIYWYKLNKLTPGKANSIPFIIIFFHV